MRPEHRAPHRPASSRSPVPGGAEPVTPPAPTIEELIVSADSVIGLQMETSITSERPRRGSGRGAGDARREGRRARGDSVGAKAYGEVTLVERGGRLKDRARLGVRFVDRARRRPRVPIETDTIIREGQSPKRREHREDRRRRARRRHPRRHPRRRQGRDHRRQRRCRAGSAAVLAGGRNAATLPSARR